jgi:hypothetical protein
MKIFEKENLLKKNKVQEGGCLFLVTSLVVSHFRIKTILVGLSSHKISSEVSGSAEIHLFKILIVQITL